MRTYRRPIVVIAACLLLVGSVAVYVLTRSGQASESSQPWVDFAPGAPVDQTFADSTGSAQAAAAQLPYARRLSDPVDIAVSGPADGARVTFPVDPAVELSPANGHTPTGGNYFIAAYNDSLSNWIPLATTYDASAQTISAVAPHFSDYAKFLVDGYTDVTGVAGGVTQAIASNGQDLLSSIENAGTSAGNTVVSAGEAFIDVEHHGLVVIGNGINGAVTGIQEAAAALMGKILDVTWPDQESADCDVNGDQHYTVTFELPLLAGCVHTQSTTTELRVQDSYLVPFDIMTSAQTGVTPKAAEIGERDLFSVLLSLEQYGLGNLFVAGRTVNSAGISPQLAEQTTWSTTVSADTNAVLLSAVLAVISALPTAKDLELASEEIITAVRAYITEHPNYAVTDLLSEIKQVLLDPAKGAKTPRSAIAVVTALQSGFECVKAEASLVKGVVEQGINEETFGKALHYGVKCAELAVSAYADSIGENLTDVLGIVAAIPELALAIPKNLANTGLAGGQALRIGPEIFSTTMTVTYDPTKISPNCINVGQCRDLPVACNEVRDLDSLSPESTALSDMYSDDYHGQYITSKVVQLCGGSDTVVVAYGADSSSQPPTEAVDVRTWDEPSKKWLKAANLPAEPYLPAGGSESVEIAHLTWILHAFEGVAACEIAKVPVLQGQ